MAAAGFIQLLRLSELGRQRQLQRKEDTLTQQWSGVGFRLGRFRLLAPLGEVSEVISVPELTMLPWTQSWMRGLDNVRGRLVAVTDLGAFVNQPTDLSINQQRRKVIIIDQPTVLAGLMVDEVYSIQHFEPTDYQPAHDRLQHDLGGLAPYVSGHFDRQGEVWLVFLLSRLVADIRFMDASA